MYEILNNSFRGQITLGIQRSHAAGARRRYRLPIDAVLGVAADEYAFHVGVRRAVFRQNVAHIVHVQPSFEDIGIRLVPDCYEEALNRDDRFFLCFIIDDLHAGHGFVGQDFFRFGIPVNFDIRCFEYAFLHNFGGAHLIATDAKPILLFSSFLQSFAR